MLKLLLSTPFFYRISQKIFLVKFIVKFFSKYAIIFLLCKNSYIDWSNKFNMKYMVNWGGGDGVFAVPDHAADCLKLASGKAVKVLLYILKNKITEIDYANLANALDVSEEDAEDAVSYWQQVGVLYPCGSEPAAVVRKNAEEKPVPAMTANDTAKEQRAKEKAAKMISPEEIADRVKKSEDVKFLFDSAENAFGKILNYTEQRTLIWLHDYYNIAPDILLMIMDLAKQTGKANMNYVEKIAINWQENNITTHELAMREINRLKNYYSFEGQAAAKLGLDRTLTPTERKFLKEWSDKGISIVLVILAYEKTIDNIGKIKFSYMNKIIKSWQENGITTVAEAKSEADKRSTENKQAESTDSGEHSYNLDLLVAHAMNNTPKIKK